MFMVPAFLSWVVLGLGTDPVAPGREVAPNPRLVALITALAVRELDPSQAARELPVRVTGVVTHSNPASSAFFVQDDTAGLHVNSNPSITERLSPGEEVEVTGVTQPGAFAPVVYPKQVRRVGPGRLPEAIPFNFDRDESRWMDGYYVRAWAVVRSVRRAGDYTVLDVYTATGQGDVYVLGNHLDTAAGLVDSAVHIRGVCVANFQKRVLVGNPKIYTQRMPEPLPGASGRIDRTISPTEAADLPNRFHPGPDPAARRLSVAGVVSAVVSDREFTLQDNNEGLTISTDVPATVSVGERVTATGLMRISGRRVGLIRAIVDKSGQGTLPPPVDTNPTDVKSGRWDGMRVRLIGIVEEFHWADGNSEMTIRSGGIHLNISFPPESASSVRAVPVGARVAVVCVPVRSRPSDDVSLIASSAANLTVLMLPAPPSWWTPGRVVALLGTVAGIGAIGFLWVGTLRSQVRAQTEQIRREMERKLELEEEYRDLFEAAGDAVWVTDMAGRFTALNPAAERMLGLPRSEAVGRPVSNFLAADMAERYLSGSLAKLAEPFEMTVTPVLGPPVLAEVTCRVLPDGRTQAIARDMTAQRKLREQVERVAKLEAVGRLAGGIAHDFNNLLTVINGGAEIIGAAVPDDPDLRRMSEDVLAAGRRAAALTGQLLAFSRNRVVALAPLNLNLEIRDVSGLLSRLVGEDVEIVTDLATDLPTIAGDSGLIQQVLLNLAVNARDAMSQSGRLTLATSLTPEGRVRLCVTDTGAGMTPEVQARLFEPFFTTKPIGQGTGLGLAVIHGAVETMNGRIAVRSEVGTGTTFEIDFPPAPSQPVSPPEATDSDRGTDEQKPRPVVLLVEDDEAVRALARHVLESAGFHLLVTDDGHTALEMATAAERLDAVVTDVRMPKMSGPDLAERLWITRPDLPVVFVSGHSEDELLRAGVRAEVVDFVGKPFTPARLVDKLREALRRSTDRG